MEDRPFAKSTLQLFRAQLILHDRVRAVFQRSLQFARQTGYLKGRRMKVAVDTTYILGRGAKDTYNLLADGIVQVVRFRTSWDAARLGLEHGLELFQLKGEAEIDWDNQKERQALLQKIGRCRPGVGAGSGPGSVPRGEPPAPGYSGSRSCWGNCYCRMWNARRMAQP